MKTYNLRGLLALSFLCILSVTLSAQSAPAETKAARVATIPAAIEYSDVSVSDPSIYADEPFSISLTVKNTGGRAVKHEVRLMLQDKSAPKGQRKQAVQALKLQAGQSETITFTFNSKDLFKKGEKSPDMFVFYLGKYEIGVGNEAK